MKLLDIIKSVGEVAVRTAVPNGGLIIDLVNSFLPEDKKLSDDATGQQLNKVVDQLPPEQLAKEFDVTIKKLDTLQTMLNADTKYTTRPKIAYQSFLVVAFSIMMAISAWGYAVFSGDVKIITNIENSWLLLLSLIGPLVTVLHAYFGVLTEEKKDRFNAAQGHKVEPIKGLFAKLFK